METTNLSTLIPNTASIQNLRNSLTNWLVSSYHYLTSQRVKFGCHGNSIVQLPVFMREISASVLCLATCLGNSGSATVMCEQLPVGNTGNYIICGITYMCITKFGISSEKWSTEGKLWHLTIAGWSLILWYISRLLPSSDKNIFRPFKYNSIEHKVTAFVFYIC